MICRLFIFSEEIGIELNLNCSKTGCEYCKDADDCVNCRDVDIHLTKESYGWVLHQRITLPTKLHKAVKLVGFENGISIIHPTHETCWIAQLKKDNETSYCILQGKSKVGCKTISQLNYSLKKNYKYDGRDLGVEDFYGS